MYVANIHRPKDGIKPAVVSVDTIELWCLYLQKGQRRAIEKVLGRKIRTERCQHGAGYRIAVNRPPLEVLPVLNAILRSSRWNRVSRLDVAYDFAPTLSPLLRNHVTLKWWRGERRVCGTTMYWKSWSKRKRRPRRSPAVYEKEDSSRLELRDYRPKITNLGELINFDPRAYFLRNVKLLRLSDRHVNKLARQEVRKETHQRRNKRSRKYLEFMNQYRAARPRRIRSMIERVGLQEFAAHHRGSKLTRTYLKIAEGCRSAINVE